MQSKLVKTENAQNERMQGEALAQTEGKGESDSVVLDCDSQLTTLLHRCNQLNRTTYSG